MSKVQSLAQYTEHLKKIDEACRGDLELQHLLLVELGDPPIEEIIVVSEVVIETIVPSVSKRKKHVYSKTKPCIDCGVEFTASSNGKRCQEHQAIFQKSYQIAYRANKDLVFIRYNNLVSRHVNKWECSKETVITFEKYKELVSQECTYCTNAAQSVDRRDSLQGYVIGNVQPICIKCNTAKLNHPETVFLQHIKDMYKKCF